MSAQAEIQGGMRFRFGANWTRFLTVLDEARIVAAERSLAEMLRVADLRNRSFLDIGCGSGLFSLAARRLGARVHSFDFDPQSVACAQELKRRYFPDDASWTVEEGSILDDRFVSGLGHFDVVYSWGVLHHTGAMWIAIENAIARVASPTGTLFIAIYNDQGWKSHAWWFVKSLYNKLPQPLRAPFAWCVGVLTRLLVIVKYTLELKPMVAIGPLLRDRRERGMSARYDAVDWIGGFPYEFATFDTLAGYLGKRGFELVSSRRDSSQGCHELVARRRGSVQCAG